MSFGAPFCRGVEPFLANLKTLIAEANRVGVGDWQAATVAKAVYEDINGFVIYTPWGGTEGDCARHTREVQAAIASISALLRGTPGASLAVPRPDAEVSSESELIPTWAKVMGFGVMGLVALHYLTPYFAPRRRVAGYRRRSRR
jgi:hypothetical protein